MVSWKIFLPLFLISLLPFPAYFRMYFEKRAYLVSLYVLSALGSRLNFNPLLKSQSQFFMQQFQTSAYYFMWPFSSLRQEFDQAVANIAAGKRPYEDPVFDMIDDLVTKV